MAVLDHVNLLGPSFTSLISLAIALVVFIFGKQPEPYMDEIFHVPQVQKYCAHRFNEWNPMITTLPGLYFSSWAFIEFLAALFKQDVETMCMPLFLRMVNIVFNIGNIWVIYRIMRKLNQMKGAELDKHEADKSSTNNESRQLAEKEKFYQTSTGITLGIFPLLFFFMFLFYTDNGSTFFVLLMYYLSLGDYHMPAAVVGLYSFFFRQTNIVWVVFTAGVTAVRIFEPLVLKNVGQRSNESFSLILEFAKQLVLNLKVTIRVLWPYALVTAFFGAFVYINGGIAVGDKKHHQVCFNFPQIFYFACFAVFFSLPHVLSPSTIYRTLLYFLNLNDRRYRPGIVVLLFTIYYLIQNYTHVHRYLLADNRHYAFYVWKNIYTAYPEAKVALIPVYLVATTMIFVSIDRSKLWRIVYGVCVAIVLIPQGLLEFRYFILPYLMFRIHLRRPEMWRLGTEFIFYAAINYVTIWTFLKKPFYWPNSNDVQRFMW